MQRILVTGGMGFIGSNFIRLLLATQPGYEIVNMDMLSYAGNPMNLEDLRKHPHYSFNCSDIADRRAVEALLGGTSFEAIINFAAESFVDRSILSSEPFIHSNVLGAQVLLDAALAFRIPRFIQVSTDEVYGSLGDEGAFTEQTPLAPNNPYSASKAAADLLCRAYHRTHGLGAIVTRCSNNYGPRQFPEKLIPLMIRKALRDEPLPVYGDGRHVRDWLYVDDHCRAILAVLQRGKAGEVYNIGGGHEMPNLELVKLLLARLGKPESLIQFVADRPGHDRRYAIDMAKIEHELGWRPEVDFAAGIAGTVDWYLSNTAWLDAIERGSYQAGYR